MIDLARRKQLLRERAEFALRVAAMNDVGRRYPGRVATPALPRQAWFLRYLFVPLYRRVPWSFKHRAMHALKMTAQNWPEDARHFGEPWRPPLVRGEQTLAPASPRENAGEASHAER